MQIHELTQKRLVNEASFGGAVGGAGAVLGGIGKQLASAASQSALGFDATDTASDQNPYGPETSFEKSKAMAAPLIRNQAVTNQKLWNQALSQQMAAQGATAINQIDDAGRAKLMLNLKQQVSNNFLQGLTGKTIGNRYTSELPKLINAGQKSEAIRAAQRLETAEDNILDFDAAAKTPAQSLADWTELATAAFDVMRLIQFFPAAGTPVSRTKTPSSSMDPKAAALMKAAGMDAAGLTRVNAAIKQSGEKVNPAGTGSPSLDALLRAAKLL